MSMAVQGAMLSPQLAESFLTATGQDVASYSAIMRGRSDPLEINGAERFVCSWIRRWITADQAEFHGQEAAIIRAVADMPKADGLALVIAAMLAIARADWTTAAALSERAYAADQHEIFAQRIFLAAAEQSASLRLAVDDWLQDRFCSNPFTDVEIIGSGDVYTCCAAWLPARIGSARDAEGNDYWNGPRAAELRRSVLDGDFGHCSRLSCPKIAARNLPRRGDVTDPVHRAVIDRRATATVPPPRRVLLSYDTSCNLSCPSCRTKLIARGHAEARELDTFYDARVAPLLKEATHIKITGSGDPFGSRHFRKVLEKLTAGSATAPRLQLHTNGVLFDRRAWEALHLDGHVRSVWVSVDATAADTYAILRRDGDFDRLQRNLIFLGDLRRQGKIGEFRLDFVVQADNYRQMPDLIDQAQRIGADGVHFLMLRNWGTFTRDEYLARAVAFNTHPEHDMLLGVLRDPRFDRPGVDLGNLAPLRQAVLAKQPVHRPSIAVPEPVPLVLILSLPRCGTNHLLDGLAGFAGLMAMKEVFNPVAAFGMGPEMLAHFGKLLQADLTGPDDPRLIGHLARHPLDSIRDLRRVTTEAGRKAVAFKLFPGQISEAVLHSEILTDPGIMPVIITRDLISCYISYRKAASTNKWALTDTTPQRFVADVDDYSNWHETVTGWWRGIAGALAAAGRSPAILSYESDIAIPFDRMILKLDKMLKTLGLDLAPTRIRPPRLFRQDRNIDPFDRVENGPAFREALGKAGLLDAALSHPMERPQLH